MFDSATERARTPATQTVWLVVYWFAASVNFFLMMQALIFAAEFSLPNLAAVVLAFVSTLIGALFATRILRRGVTTTVFVRCTTTVRTIAVAWTLLAVAIFSGSVIAVIAQLETSEVDWSAGFAGAVGSISILAVLGPGYKEYRDAVAP